MEDPLGKVKELGPHLAILVTALFWLLGLGVQMDLFGAPPAHDNALSL